MKRWEHAKLILDNGWDNKMENQNPCLDHYCGRTKVQVQDWVAGCLLQKDKEKREREREKMIDKGENKKST